MSGKKQHAAQEPAPGNTEPASAVPTDDSTQASDAGPSETAEQPAAPKVVQALRSNGGGGRRVMATATINRVGGQIRPGQEFELVDEKEATRLKGAFKEI